MNADLFDQLYAGFGIGIRFLFSQYEYYKDDEVVLERVLNCFGQVDMVSY